MTRCPRLHKATIDYNRNEELIHTNSHFATSQEMAPPTALFICTLNPLFLGRGCGMVLPLLFQFNLGMQTWTHSILTPGMARHPHSITLIPAEKHIFW